MDVVPPRATAHEWEDKGDASSLSLWWMSTITGPHYLGSQVGPFPSQVGPYLFHYFSIELTIALGLDARVYGKQQFGLCLK